MITFSLLVGGRSLNKHHHHNGDLKYHVSTEYSYLPSHLDVHSMWKQTAAIQTSTYFLLSMPLLAVIGVICYNIVTFIHHESTKSPNGHITSSRHTSNPIHHHQFPSRPRSIKRIQEEESFLSPLPDTKMYKGQNGYQCITEEALEDILHNSISSFSSSSTTSQKVLVIATQMFTEEPFLFAFLNSDCMKQYSSDDNNNNANSHNPKASQNHIGSSRSHLLPHIISSQIKDENDLMGIIRGIDAGDIIAGANASTSASSNVKATTSSSTTTTKKESFVIYIHREEIDRLAHVIKHHLIYKLCPPTTKNVTKTRQKKAKCTIDENKLLDMILNEKDEEVEEEEGGGGNHKNNNSMSFMGATYTLWTCSTFEAMDAMIKKKSKDDTRMIIVNYNQVKTLQKILAKHYNCPMITEATSSSSSSLWKKNQNEEDNNNNNQMDNIRIKVNDKTMVEKEVSIDEWIEKKIYHLHWGFHMKKDASCQYRIREMEDEIFRCKEGMIRFDETYERTIYEWPIHKTEK